MTATFVSSEQDNWKQGEPVLEEFLDMLYPPFENIVTGRATDNAIVERHICVFADQGAGKSNAGMWLVNEAVKRYGLVNVHLKIADARDFGEAIEHGWNRKPVNIMLINDLTKVDVPDDDVYAFQTIRHKMHDATGLNEGLCLLIFTGHRIFDTKISLRSDADFTLWMSIPTDDYDYKYMVRRIGEKAVQLLEASEKRRLQNPVGTQGDAFITYKRERLGFAHIPKQQTSERAQQILRPQILNRQQPRNGSYKLHDSPEQPVYKEPRTSPRLIQPQTQTRSATKKRTLDSLGWKLGVVLSMIGGIAFLLRGHYTLTALFLVLAVMNAFGAMRRS